jgi:hypothetical protein
VLHAVAANISGSTYHFKSAPIDMVHHVCLLWGGKQENRKGALYLVSFMNKSIRIQPWKWKQWEMEWKGDDGQGI